MHLVYLNDIELVGVFAEKTHEDIKFFSVLDIQDKPWLFETLQEAEDSMNFEIGIGGGFYNWLFPHIGLRYATQNSRDNFLSLGAPASNKTYIADQLVHRFLDQSIDSMDVLDSSDAEVLTEKILSGLRLISHVPTVTPFAILDILIASILFIQGYLADTQAQKEAKFEEGALELGLVLGLELGGQLVGIGGAKVYKIFRYKPPANARITSVPPVLPSRAKVQKLPPAATFRLKAISARCQARFFQRGFSKESKSSPQTTINAY